MRPECSGCPVLSNTLIGSLSEEQVSRFTCVFRPTRYRRKQVLFFEGGATQHVFALRSGLVKMVKPLANGKERIVRVLVPGEIFGLEALSEATYPLSGVVLQDSEICAVSRDEFLALLRANPDVTLEIVRFLVGEMSRIRGQITSLSFKDARTRLATFLLSLITPERGLSTRTCSLTLPLSSQEIGDVLELSSETVSRTWNRLRREGLVQKRGRHVVVQDVNALERVAHS